MPRLSTAWLFLVAACFALLLFSSLRVAQMEPRPLHTDEAVQAWQTWRLMLGEGYRYDPADKHGPFLYYFTAAAATLTGQGAEGLSTSFLRSIPLIAGLGFSLLLLLERRRLGKETVLFALLITALSPLATLYQSYFIQEAFLASFTWALLFLFLRWLDRPSLPLALGLGVFAGLLHACKETSALHLGVLALCLPLLRPTWPSLPKTKLLAHLALALFGAGLVLVLLFSSFGSNPRGVLDAFLSFSHYAAKATQSPHAQPWHAYLALFMPFKVEGVRWGETLFLLLALLGGLLCLRPSVPRAWRLISLFSWGLFAAYSLIPHKSPWLILTPTLGFCLLAAKACTETPNLVFRSASNSVSTPRLALRRGLSLALLLLVGLELGRVHFLALHRYPGDPRVPYFYQQTSPDLLGLVAQLQALPPSTSIAICSPDDAWPLPWYLRTRQNIGYFKEIPQGTYDLLIIDSRLDNTLSAKSLHGLRPNVILTRHDQVSPSVPRR